MRKCGRQGCEKEATFIPKLCVPAKDVPIDLHQPIGCFFGLELCAEHIDDNELRVWILNNRQFRAVVDRMTAEQGKAPADHARAWVMKLPIDSEEYKNYMAGVLQRRKTG